MFIGRLSAIRKLCKMEDICLSVNILKNGQLRKIAGNAKDADPGNITPESIGAIAKTGDTMTGLLQLEIGSIFLS